MQIGNTLSIQSITQPACWGPGTYIAPLLAPGELRAALPLGDLAGFVAQSRDAVRRVLSGTDGRLLVVAGPCSVHDPMAAMEYAHWLAGQAARFREHLLIVMRACVEKPMTLTGWTGLVNDPCLDGSCDIAAGLRAARAVLLDITAAGLPTMCEWVNPATAPYLADAVTLGVIGARTAESQVHRHLASALPMPVAFKNPMDGNVQAAVNAIVCAALGHTFPGVSPDDGSPATIRSAANPDCSLVLRGGRGGPNYSAAHVASALDLLSAAGLPRRLMIDASHGNSGKDHHRQAEVAITVAGHLARGQAGIVGVLLESFLVDGRQDLPEGKDTLTYGQSVTDACINTEITGTVLELLATAVQARRTTEC
jgi:3-deoxy-7-phosphoheptulonate synthase